MYKSPDYSSVCTLIHEFMHATNIGKHIKIGSVEDNLLRLEFTEFVSIYFEFYARDYLINKCNIDNNKIDFTER